jgi:hypothetical protein
VTTARGRFDTKELDELQEDKHAAWMMAASLLGAPALSFARQGRLKALHGIA